MDLSAIRWLAVYWSLISAIGAVYTNRNFWLSWRDWRTVVRLGLARSLAITAFTSVRTHGLLLGAHLTFIVMGLISITQPTPVNTNGLPTTIYGIAITAIVLAIPHVLIVISYTIHRDRLEAMALAARGL